MATTPANTKKSRSEVRRQYGHPWPWTSRELFREHVVESDATNREIADEWATEPDTISRWARRHDFADGGPA